MRIVDARGQESVATVYIGQFEDGRLVEFVESVQPPIPREQKWVLILSVLFGCPVRCPICDAGGEYRGRLTREEMLAQIDYLVRRRYPSGRVPAAKFKVQFARMGEPALNPAVLDVLEALPRRFDAPGLLPSISTVAPQGAESFFDRLIDLKETLYPEGRFQLQFSIHSSSAAVRDRLIPVPKWSLSDIARYGERFWKPDDRKIALNFALAEGVPIDATALRRVFDPERYLIKITPINPTRRAVTSGIRSFVDAGDPQRTRARLSSLEEIGFDVLLSIGELEENQIGSNCGQFVGRVYGDLPSNMRSREDSYAYWRTERAP